MCENISQKKKLPTDRVAQSLSSTLFKQIMKLCWQWVKVANIIIEWNDEVCPYSIWTVKISISISELLFIDQFQEEVSLRSLIPMSYAM